MASESVVCGYCMEKDEQLIDPRSLPCHHIHCFPCLVGDFEANRTVRCGTCKAVFDVTLARLPSAMKREDNLQFCDICVDNESGEELAVSYCTTCSRKMCTKHLELHGQFYSLHRDVLDIQEYQNKAKMLKERRCATHPDEPIVLGCSTCFGVLCVTCLDGAKGCIDGSAHLTIKLEKLLNLLKEKRDNVKTEAWVKDGEFSNLLKRSLRILSRYEKKTQELVDQLHDSRDKQLTELRRMYDELERELVDNRRTSKEQLVEFIEMDIGVRMTEMNTLLLLQDAKFKESHQVDIINSFTATYNEIRRFIVEDLPSLTLTNQKTLFAQADERKPEVEMVDGSDVFVQLILPQTSLKLMKEIHVEEKFYTVAHSDRFTYAGGSGSNLSRIDKSDNSVTSLLLLEGEYIDGLCLYNERLYILLHPYKVLVTNMNGKLITSWAHYDFTSWMDILLNRSLVYKKVNGKH
ncbi:E3 ubiquitin-protein ligase TRIM56-like [Watersipora subatra]|uniref:E3 ubiquitin-protein ligase TRIM56-like n=1 Tax=Watersipora subatra TaxID=2589382 RepID=UPI00355BBB6C